MEDIELFAPEPEPEPAAAPPPVPTTLSPRLRATPEEKTAEKAAARAEASRPVSVTTRPQAEASGETPASETAAAPKKFVRPLHIVINLRGGDAGGYEGSLAVGSQNCDPAIRPIEVANLSEILEPMLAVVEEGLQMWEKSTRYPRYDTPKATKPKTEKPDAPAVKSTSAPASNVVPLTAAKPKPEAPKPDAEQTPLF